MDVRGGLGLHHRDTSLDPPAGLGCGLDPENPARCQKERIISSHIVLKSTLALLGASLIWGLSFVAQRVSLETIGPFTFNGLRFVLGALSLIPLIWLQSRRRPEPVNGPDRPESRTLWRKALVPGLICGCFLFAGANFQQAGMIWTSAGKAAFLTSFYIILVPLAGLFWHHAPGWRVWGGAVFAIVGLFFLSVGDGFSFSPGDLMQLAGAVFWTGHILATARFSPETDVLRLAFIQYLVCAVLSLVPGFIFEAPDLAKIEATLWPLVYAGFGSVGIAFTLQAFGQKGLKPGPAALLLCLETVFAALGGGLILGEVLQGRELLGCVLMLGGTVLSQIPGRKT